ncbi:MAG: HD-GYP domain-containing protein [Anaerolineales bacterium]|jgi:putative two-component system response regulator
MSQETILIVEDNPILREGLQEMLELDGFAVFTAANGQQALDEMADRKPDLILSDIAMPVMDGHTFFRMVRERSEWVSIPFVFLTARGEREDVLAGKDMGAEDYLVKPVTREDLVTVVNSRLERSHQLHVVQLQRAYETSLAVLANAIEVRDQYTRGHVERVMSYSFAIAEKVTDPAVDHEQLRFGAMLHDIGKINIRETTLCKQDSLSTVEWSEIQLHPATGAEMIKDIPYLMPAIPAVRYHHERWDGSGYPDGLRGEEIPLVARIVSVADAFDAMTTDRPYSAARSLEQAKQEILVGSGSRYDPFIVEAFMKSWDSGRIQEIASKPPELLT